MGANWLTALNTKATARCCLLRGSRALRKTVFALYLTLSATSVFGQAVLSLDTGNGMQNGGGDIAINIANSPVSAGFNANIILPAGISIVGVSSGELLTSAGGFTSEFCCSGETDIRVLSYDATSTFSGSGQLLVLHVQIDPGVGPGLYPVNFATTNTEPLVNSRYALSDEDGSNSIEPAVVGSTFLVYDLASDFDGDGLSDDSEINTYLTDPIDIDTDGDGVNDGTEVDRGTDPLVADAIPVKRLSGLADVSGDGVPDIAHINEDATKTVDIISGSDGSIIRQIEFFGVDWNVIAISTLEDGNLDGVSNDPAIAMLARNNLTGLNRVRVLDAVSGERRGSNITFFDSTFAGIDLAVLNDQNGDGVPNDPSLAVLAKQDTGRVAVLLKRFSDGSVLGNWTFTKPDFDALAVEGVSPAGEVPAISVLYRNNTTGKSRIRTRRADNGQWMQGIFVAGPARDPSDFAVITDLNGDGAKDDQAYAILLKVEGGNNRVRFRNVGTGDMIKETLFIAGSWEMNSLTVLPDTDSNGFEDLAGEAERNAGVEKIIKVRDFDTIDTLQNIFH